MLALKTPTGGDSRRDQRHKYVSLCIGRGIGEHSRHSGEGCQLKRAGPTRTNPTKACPPESVIVGGCLLDIRQHGARGDVRVPSCQGGCGLNAINQIRRIEPVIEKHLRVRTSRVDRARHLHAGGGNGCSRPDRSRWLCAGDETRGIAQCNAADTGRGKSIVILSAFG